MKERWISPLSKVSGLLLLLLLGLVSGMTACTPAAAPPPSPEAQPYTFYLVPWAEHDEQQLLPLDPETLQAQPEGQKLAAGIFSADGSTRVEVAYADGYSVNTPNLNPGAVSLIVQNLPDGSERSRFHPPVSGLIKALSQDGERLLLVPFPYPPSPHPPRIDWYVIDTAGGQVLAHIKDEDNACFRQYAHFGPAGRRIYCIVAPAVTAADEPEAMRIVAYDVAGEEKAAELELPGALIGGRQRETDSAPVQTLLEPALALSPNGQRLSVVHADMDVITLIDAQTLSVEKTFSLQQPTSLWNRFGLAPAAVQAKGEMEGTIRQAVFSHDGQYLYVFTQELWSKQADAPAERGLWLVDLAGEQIAAEALPDYQMQWVRPAPDGTVYAFGTTDENLVPYEIRPTSPSTLWRLDGRSLEVLVERPFTGYRGSRLVLGTAVTHKAPTTSAPNCPVTQPPQPAFVPPKPWPALPVDGNWRQLALGEKFW